MLRRLTVICVFVALGCSSAFAENALFIESKTVGIGASGTVGVYLSNDVPIRSFCIPLVVREVTPGVYPTALSAEYVQGARLSDYLIQIRHLHIYDEEDGTCKAGQPGGFGTVTVNGIQTVEHPSPSNPDGFGFVRQTLFGNNLPAGSDGAVPSMAFGFTAPMVQGSFEIDTTCNGTSCHLLFSTDASEGISPVFTKGIIDVVPCDCPSQADIEPDGYITALDLSACVDILFAGSPDIQDQGCPSPRFDFDCDGFSTALDLSSLIDHLFAGSPATGNPCDAF